MSDLLLHSGQNDSAHCDDDDRFSAKLRALEGPVTEQHSKVMGIARESVVADVRRFKSASRQAALALQEVDESRKALSITIPKYKELNKEELVRLSIHSAIATELGVSDSTVYRIIRTTREPQRSGQERNTNRHRDPKSLTERLRVEALKSATRQTNKQLLSSSDLAFVSDFVADVKTRAERNMLSGAAAVDLILRIAKITEVNISDLFNRHVQQ